MKKCAIIIFEILLFILNLYFGIYALLDMLCIKYKIKLLDLIFWDDINNTFKFPKYTHLALEYEMHPEYSILISAVMILLFALFVLLKKIFPERNMINISKKAYFIIGGIVLFSFFITYGVIYCYFYELSAEVV